MAITITHKDNEFGIGDIVRVHQKIQDSGKKKGEITTRIQVFEGTVISINGKQENKMFTVRRIGAGGVGIERIFPIFAPIIDKVEVSAKGDVRRAKLYYLRDQTVREVSEITKRYLRKAQAAKQMAAKQSQPKKAAKKVEIKKSAPKKVIKKAAKKSKKK